nr:carbohydrate kinase [Anaerolineaceae bacterium]
MSRENLLAIDAGTQSVRALLFDLRGNLIAKSQIPIVPYYSVNPGWAEQDAEVFWKAVCDACQQLWTRPGVDKATIAGVSITS